MPEKRHLVNPVVTLDQDSESQLQKNRIHHMTGIVSSFVADLETRFDPDILREVYRKKLYAAGFGCRGNKVDIAKAAIEYVDAVQPLRYVRELSVLPKTIGEGVNFLSCMIRRHRYAAHPLLHLSLIYWLFDTWSSFMSSYTLARNESLFVAVSEIIKDDVIAHEETDPRKAALIGFVRDKAESVRSAANKIGIDTTTAMAWLAASGIATKRRSKIIRGELREHLIADLIRGIDKNTAASEYKISTQSITTLLRTEPGLNAAWLKARLQQKTREMRQDWSKLVAECSEHGTKHLRSLAPATYAWLYRNDSVWLKQAVEDIPKVRKGNHRNLDWSARDLDIAGQIRQVALQIIREEPGRKIKRWQLFQRIPDLRAKLDVLERLPLTRQAIDDACNADVENILSGFTGE